MRESALYALSSRLPCCLSLAVGLSRSHRVGFYKYWAVFFSQHCIFPASCCCYCCCRCCSYSYVSIGRLFSPSFSPPSPSAVIRCRLGLVFVAFLDKRLLHSAFNYQRVDKSSSSLSLPVLRLPVCGYSLLPGGDFFIFSEISNLSPTSSKAQAAVHVFSGAALGSFNCSISANWCRPDGAVSGHVE